MVAWIEQINHALKSTTVWLDDDFRNVSILKLSLESGDNLPDGLADQDIYEGCSHLFFKSEKK